VKKESKILIGFVAVLLVALPLMGSVIAADVDGQESNETNNLLGKRIELEVRINKLSGSLKTQKRIL